MFYKNSTLIGVVSLLSLGLISAQISAASVDKDTLASTSAEAWTYGISPYLWATSMRGIVGVAHHDVHVAQNFNDVLKQLKFGWMLDLDANKGKLGLYLRSLYSVTATNNDVHHIALSAKNKYGIFNLGGSYQLLKHSWSGTNSSQASTIALNPYVGVRYTINNTLIHVADIPLKNHQDWADPLVGMRLDYTINSKWLTRVSGDIGGTSSSRDYSYSVTGLLGYQQTPHRILFIGYELLKQKYIHGTGIKRFEWAMNIYGPVVGVRFEV